LKGNGALVDPERLAVTLRVPGGEYHVTFETRPVGEEHVLAVEGHRYAPATAVRYEGDRATIYVSENTPPTQARLAVAAALAEVHAVVRARAEGLRVDATSALVEGSRPTRLPDGSFRYELSPRDAGRVAAMRMLAHDLLHAERAGDVEAVAALRTEAVRLTISYGLGERPPGFAVHSKDDNILVVGPEAAELRMAALREHVGARYHEIAPVAEILREAGAAEMAQQVHEQRAAERALLREGARRLIVERDRADAELTRRVAELLDAQPGHVFDRLIVGNGWSAVADYLGTAPAAGGDGVPRALCIGVRDEPWLARGALRLGQVHAELEVRGFALQASDFGDRPGDFARSDDFGLAVGASRALGDVPTFHGLATAVEARPAGTTPGWPDGANFRVVVDGRPMYASAVDVTTGLGPARIPPADLAAAPRFVDPASGASRDSGTGAYHDRSGSPVRPEDLPEEALAVLGVGDRPPLLADGQGRLTDPRLLDPRSGYLVDPATRALSTVDGRPVDPAHVAATDPEALARLGFDPDGGWHDPRPDARADRVHFGGEVLPDGYRPGDRILVYGAGASGSWDIEVAAVDHTHAIHWAARAKEGLPARFAAHEPQALLERSKATADPVEKAELERDLHFFDGYNRRNTDSGGGYAPEVWARTVRELHEPVGIVATVDGRLSVRFSDHQVHEFDGVVLSIGQEAGALTGPGALVGDARLQPLYGPGGEVHGLRDASGHLRVLGASSVAGPVLGHLPSSLGLVRDLITRDQPALLPEDSRGVVPSIRNMAGRIADVNHPGDSYRPGVFDRYGMLEGEDVAAVQHLVERGHAAYGLNRPHLAILRSDASDPGAVTRLKSLDDASPASVSDQFGEFWQALRELGLSEVDILLNGQAAGLTAADAATGLRAALADPENSGPPAGSVGVSD
jgi:hypothetical protein